VPKTTMNLLNSHPVRRVVFVRWGDKIVSSREVVLVL
jgi:hypothetical protein